MGDDLFSANIFWSFIKKRKMAKRIQELTAFYSVQSLFILNGLL